MIAKKLLTTIAFAFVLLFSGCAEDDFNEVDGLCPLVISTVPEDGDFDVPLNQVITATFNEKMNPSTITETSFTVSANGALIDGTVSYNGLTATFIPSSPLDEDTEYTGTITTLAKDERGNALQEDYVWSFTTVLPLPEYAVEVSSSPTIGGLTAGAGLFDQGTAVTVTAVPNVGYTFTNWTENGVQVSTSPNYQFVLIGDRTLVANYTLIPPAQFSVNASALPVAGGSTTGSGSYDTGSNVTVTATANNGYTFVNWTLAGVQVSTNANYTFVLNANKTLVANFTENAYTLNVTAVNGTVVKNPNNATYTNGTNVELTATPNSGYEFLNWTGDATGTNNPLTVLMNGNKNITANFILIANAGGACATPAVDLGTAKNYAILAESGISTTGTTSVTGNMGIFPLEATYITGFDLILTAGAAYSTSSLVTGKIYAPSYAVPTPTNLNTAVNDMHTAFTTANGLAVDVTEYLAGNLNGQTLTTGVYKWGTGLSITNGITLDGGGQDCAKFVFIIGQDLTVGDGAIITLTNGAKADNIFWVVAGSKAELGTTVQFQGNILSKTLISLNTGATINGRLLAQTAVTLNAATVVKP
ncbi:MAG TPA: ice-binding family protein [Lutibacter sp.]